ncbi:flagellar filament capping protein FliD [Jeongeupia chitinilytica]|uniref:Flagellar hook-associated protein 2 n=1 Tax=Jeongeupia chitinilytica TaxID=1041641 RepID=A0ABQ3GYV3_9NEIS|nr:flagellar filament capping protein FliD [Jeongeupia chitinilytica]GHD61095.1 flagellar hook-associated protein 2 [Jeongeupia chitinilytica]
MATITTNGGSGLDINSIVSQLMQIEQQPIAKLNTKEASFQSQLSALGTIKSALSTFQTAVSSLLDLSKLNGVKASSSNSDAATVSASNTADLGNFSLDVLKLAQRQRLTSQAGQFTAADQVLIPAGSGVNQAKLTFTFGKIDASATDGFTPNASAPAKSVTISDGNSDGKITLAEVRDSINKQTDLGVTASIVKDADNSVRLVLTGTNTGENYAFKVGVTTNDANGDPVATDLSKLAFDPKDATTDAAGNLNTSGFTILKDSQAQNAKAKVNGIDVSSASNTLTEVVNGLTINLLKPTTDSNGVSTPIQLTSARDSSSIKTALTAFVKAYNDVQSSISQNASYNAETKTAGILQGDASVRGVQSQLRSMLGQAFGGGDAAIQTLSQLGVAFQQDGKLALDSAKLDKAVTNNLDSVMSFLGSYDKTKNPSKPPASSADSFGVKLNDMLDKMLTKGGTMDSRTDGINSSIKLLDKQRDAMTAKLTETEARLRKQYVALDQALTKMQQSSNSLMSMLSSLSSN